MILRLNNLYLQKQKIRQKYFKNRQVVEILCLLLTVSALNLLQFESQFLLNILKYLEGIPLSITSIQTTKGRSEKP